MLKVYILLTLSSFCTSFLTPTIRTSSNKKLNIIGQGPPILFSTGLFGTMPRFFYNDFVNIIKKNNTIVTIDGLNPIFEETVDEVCDALRVDKIGYVGHSSFIPEVLDNVRISSALLIDPINLPWFNFDGLTNSIINVKFPLIIIKAEKLYKGSKTLPEWQSPEFKGKYEEVFFDDVGHPDILDNTWANIAKTIGIWEMAEGNIMNYKNWSLNVRNEIPKIRKDYRKFAASKIFLNN